MSMKNSNDTIGNRTRDLPTCSAVPHLHLQGAVCFSGYNWGIGCTVRSIVPTDEMVNNDSNFNMDYDEKIIVGIKGTYKTLQTIRYTVQCVLSPRCSTI